MTLRLIFNVSGFKNDPTDSRCSPSLLLHRGEYKTPLSLRSRRSAPQGRWNHVFIALIFLIGSLSTPCAKADAKWTEAQLRILRSLSLASLPAVPADPSNQYADNPQARTLGQKLFFDAQLSANGQLSCASCHQPDKYFTDGKPRAVGVRATGRNTPSVIASAWSRWLYWDGRRDSLWAQALVPFEAADEMGSSRVAVVRRVGQQADYRQLYQSVFGAFADALLNKDLPAQAGPWGDAQTRQNWFLLPPNTQQLFNKTYSNLGKALAAYQRTLLPQPSRFDRYVQQLTSSVSAPTVSRTAAQQQHPEILSAVEIEGLKLFIDDKQAQCLRCHNGPLFTNEGFHNIGSGNFKGTKLDFGRSLGLQAVMMDEFNCLGPYSDALPEQCSDLRFLNKSSHAPMQGAYKTPSLRNVSRTAPYFHDGRFNSLREVLDYYHRPPQDNGPHELKPLALTEQQLIALVAFLETLN